MANLILAAMAEPKFIVFSLPRSRSNWLAHFLAEQDDKCDAKRVVCHDLAIHCSSIGDFLQQFDPPTSISGSCETGAVEGWRILLERRPYIRPLVVFREPEQVKASLAKFGLRDDEAIDRRWLALQALAEQPGVPSFDFDELGKRSCAEALFLYCTGQQCPDGWFEHLNALNIQINMEHRIALLQANAPQIAKLKAEVALASAHLLRFKEKRNQCRTLQ